MLTFSVKRENVYEVSFDKIKLGELEMNDDGFYYYFPFIMNGGAISGWILLEIGNKLEELNTGYNRTISNYFNS